jgi:beta-glucosidase
MVNTKYVTGVKEALEADDRYEMNGMLKDTYDAWIKEHPFDAGIGWAAEPWFQQEMPISKELAESAAAEADVAIVLIGRTAGEDQDNSNSKGSYLLTDDELTILENVTAAFEKTVVLLNTGNIIDMKWVEKFNPTSVAYIWQGGQEGGSGAWDVVTGDVNPCGRLSDTIAYDIADYPSTANFGSKNQNIQKEDIYVGYRYFETFAKDKVLYPFGFGLSYTTFEINATGFEAGESDVTLKATVTNTGDKSGKQVVQVYLEKPQGLLGNPARVLVGFAKTRMLNPGESEELTITFPAYYMASFDDAGVTGHKSAYVLESGQYTFYVGDSVRADKIAGAYTLNDTVVIEQLESAMAPIQPFNRIKPQLLADGTYEVTEEPVPQATITPAERRKMELKADIAYTGDKGYKLSDVRDGKCTMEQFIAQLSDKDLACIVRGEGMSSPKVTPGTGGAFGGVTEELKSFGIPVACCSDGPSGIRMDSGKKAFAMPNGTCLACTWNLPLQEELYQWEGLELRKNKIDVLLGPGMNLHRNPLNGRNFEYFSEDPFLTGKCAAAQLKGMHKYDVTGTIKHFALNTQEAGRHFAEHVASERAIRELYLKSFEIAVKEGNAHAVMTTYGPVNGVYTSSNYDLVTHILRDEWGFEGIVMSDWWARGGITDGNSTPKDVASIVRAQNDLYMVTTDSKTNTNGDNAEEELAQGKVSRSEFQKCAANICQFIMDKPVFFRYTGTNDELDKQLMNEADDEELAFDKMIICDMGGTDTFEIDPAEIRTARNATNMLSIAVKKRGTYRLTMTVRADAKSPLAQIPLTIFRDTTAVKMVTLNGSDTTWRDITVDFEEVVASFYIKLYFALDGMEIQSMKVELVEELNDELLEMLIRED